MSDLDTLIAEIRQRHARVEEHGPIWVDDGEPAHLDRAALLDIVDRLAEELAGSQAAYYAVCRSVGTSLRRPMQHGADPEPLTLDGGAQ